MIVGFQVLLIGLLADVISGNRKLLEDLLYRVRSLELPPRDRRSAARAGRRALGAARIGGSAEWPTRQRSRSSFPPSTKRDAIGEVVAALAAAGPWREIIVVDDGSTRRHRRRARRPRAPRSSRHPYNKGNGAAVKSGIRARDRRVHADHRRRRPASAGRCAAARRAARRVRPRRRRAIDATRRRRTARRLGNARAEPARELPHRARDSRPDVGLPRARGASTCASSCTCCRTASRRRRRRRWRSSRRATTSRSSRSRRARASAQSKIRLARDGAKFLDHHPQDRDALQPAARLPADRRRVVRRSAPATALWTIATQSQDPERVGAADHVRGHRVSRRPRLRADFRAALRRPAVTARMRPPTRGGG